MLETAVAVCEKTKPRSFHPWRCLRAAGHDSDCMWPTESEHYNVPLETHDAAWLASEVRVLLTRIERLQADHEAMNVSLRHRFGTLCRGLIELAPANSKRKTVPTEAVQRLWQAANG
jgi:hypothetical protein